MRSVHSGERAWSVTAAWRASDRAVATASPASAGSRSGWRDEADGLADGAPGDAESPGARGGRAVVDGGRRAGRRAAGGARPRGPATRLGLGRVALEVDELDRHPHAALAVGDGVVDLLHHGGPAALEALDDGEAPQRAGCGRTARRRGVAARSRSWRSVPGPGRATRRTWRSRSRSGSSRHAGGARRPSARHHPLAQAGHERHGPLPGGGAGGRRRAAGRRR